MREENLAETHDVVLRKIVTVPPMSETTEMTEMMSSVQFSVTLPDRTKNLPRNASPRNCSPISG